jgi:hypothetical protein
MLFALAAAVLGGGAALAGEPAEKVFAIYDIYLDRNADPSGFAERYESGFMSVRLRDLFAAYEANASQDEVGAIDFDPFINAQDYSISDVTIVSETIDGDRATVVAAFTNFDRRDELTYSLVREDGTWKIDDIESKNGDYPWVLSALLSGG